jgi:biopolymer transport protein ExbB
MLQEIFIAAAAGGNPSNALSQMGFEHLIHEMTTSRVISRFLVVLRP